MLTGEKYRADSDSRSQDVREHHFHSGLWDRCFGRDRSRHYVRQRRSGGNSGEFTGGAERQQLLHSEHAEHAFGMHRRRDYHRRKRHCQWITRSRTLAKIVPLLACVLSCRPDDNPQAAFDHAYQALLHGNLLQAQDEARRESERFHTSSSEWAWKFRTLEAKAMLHRGLYDEALKLLGSAPMPSGQPELVIPILTNVGLADVSTHRFSDAEHSLSEAAKLCETSATSSCGYVLQARGLLSSERSESQSAKKLFQASLSFARAHGDAFLESDSLVNLGYESLAQGHFDEAIDRSEAAYRT